MYVSSFRMSIGFRKGDSPTQRHLPCDLSQITSFRTKSAILIHTENFRVSFSRSTSPAKLSYSWFTHRALGTFMTDALDATARRRSQFQPIAVNMGRAACRRRIHIISIHWRDTLAMKNCLQRSVESLHDDRASERVGRTTLARSLGRGALSLCPVDSGCLKPSSVVADSFAPLAGSPPRLAPPPQLTCPIVPCS